MNDVAIGGGDLVERGEDVLEAELPPGVCSAAGR